MKQTIGKFTFWIITVLVLAGFSAAIANALMGGTDLQSNKARLAYEQAVQAELMTVQVLEKAIQSKDLATQSRQLSECVYANAQVADFSNGFLELSNEKLDHLKTKCDFQ